MSATESSAAYRWVEFALRYADGRIEPQPNIGLREAQNFARRHGLTVVSRVVTATEWQDADV